MKLIHNVIPGTWGYKIDEQLADGTFETIGKTIHDIRQTDNVYPSREDLFKAFRLCSFEDTKVVLIGQD
jgi:uracil-DNA glycosylase